MTTSEVSGGKGAAPIWTTGGPQVKPKKVPDEQAGGMSAAFGQGGMNFIQTIQATYSSETTTHTNNI